MDDEEQDDLDALMAEAEMHGPSSTDPARSTSSKSKADNNQTIDEDAEAAMAEMDGLW